MQHLYALHLDNGLVCSVSVVTGASPSLLEVLSPELHSPLQGVLSGI